MYAGKIGCFYEGFHDVIFLVVSTPADFGGWGMGKKIVINNLSLHLLRNGLSKTLRKKKVLPKKYYTAMKKTKVWSCIVVLVILMIAMSGYIG